MKKNFFKSHPLAIDEPIFPYPNKTIFFISNPIINFNSVET